MATWQQGINSGGFLAGIGGKNSNAPKASDVSEALAYIRQNNEMERSGRNNIGLQALQGLGSVAQTYQAAKQQEADAAFQKEYAAAIQSGDRQQVREAICRIIDALAVHIHHGIRGRTPHGIPQRYARSYALHERQPALILRRCRDIPHQDCNQLWAVP
jgi:hypothetical protein